MEEKLYPLFYTLEKTVYELRQKDKNYDGLQFWQPLKKILSKHDNIKVKNWKKINKSIQNKIMKLPEYYVDGNEVKHIIENNHFIIQQVRIPMKDEPNLRKILQLALNIGQFRGTSTRKFRKSLSYSTSGLNELSTYLSDANIKKISSEIPASLVNKILKYLNSKK